MIACGSSGEHGILLVCIADTDGISGGIVIQFVDDTILERAVIVVVVILNSPNSVVSLQISRLLLPLCSLV